jgi:hypothetical protein
MFLLSILFRGSAFVAQPDRATGFEPVGWGFESLRTQTPGSLWDFATCIGILRDRRVNGCTPPGMRSADGSTQRRHRRRPSPFQQGSRGPFRLPPASCGRILLMCIFMQPCSQFEEGSKKSGAVIIHQIDQAGLCTKPPNSISRRVRARRSCTHCRVSPRARARSRRLRCTIRLGVARYCLQSCNSVAGCGFLPPGILSMRKSLPRVGVMAIHAGLQQTIPTW